jgi:VIT1/CCC1 family predicted Fe2+/Mn2+ transporter
MASLPLYTSTRVLDPIDRISEVLFGLIMVLTFTGSLSVAEAARDDVRAMLVGALGCNLAWGLIDAIFYLMGRIAEHGRNLKTFHAIRRATNTQVARQLIVDGLPPVVAGLLQPAEIESIRERLTAMPEPAGAADLTKEDYVGAFGVFWLVFLSTFPVAIPFLVMPDARPALRVSNAIAVVLLFLTGYSLGRLSGRSPLLVGGGMVVVGLVLVAITIALGG